MIKRATNYQIQLFTEVWAKISHGDMEGILSISIEEILTDWAGNPVKARYEPVRKGKTGKIYINSQYFYGLEGKKALGHEIGHHVYNTKLTEEQKRIWDSYSKNYSGLMIDEKTADIKDPQIRIEDHFCDCYAHYNFQLTRLKDKEPEAYNVFEVMYGNRGV